MENQKDTQKNPQYKYASTREKLCFGIGAIGKDAICNLVGAFLMLYFTDTLYLAPAFVGVLFFVARIWDAINDPMMGMIVDNTHTRFGKFRIWLVIGTLVNSVVFVLLFHSFNLSGTALYVYVSVMYILYGMTYTIMDVPYWSWLPNLTNDPHEREKVSVIPRFFASLAGFSVATFGLYIINYLNKVAGESNLYAEKGYTLFAIIIAVIFIVTIGITVFNVKEESTLGISAEKTSLKQAFQVIVKNDQLLAFIGLLLTFNLCTQIAKSFAVYYFKKGKYSRTSLKRTAVGVSVLSLCVLVALGSGFLVFRDLNQYAESKDAYRDLAGYVEVPEQTASPESAPDPTEPKRDDTDIVLPSVDFETLRENGPDIIGWLSLPDTVLNYPVTQTDNNEYYLNHLYDGTYNKVGCLFADYENRADFSDRNTIIYGHNMRDGSMFALLNRYDEQSYFDTHRQMYLVTPKGGYVMEIFTAFAAKPEESGSKTSPWQLSWKDDGAYTTWLTAMKERSAVESDVTVTCSDKVLTLSTCTPGGTGRFLVMGKLVKVDNEI